MALKRFLLWLLAIVGLGALLYAVIAGGGKLPWWVWLGGILVLPQLMDTVMRVGEKRTSQAIRGAEAEESVAAELDKLDDRFHVVHDVIVGPGNIDHVVVAPAGVFTLETKSHKGQVTFQDDQLLLGGRPVEKNMLAQSYAEAMALKEHLKKATGKDFFVTPVLVFTSAFVKVRGKAKGVEVLPLKWLNERLSRGHEVLDADERARLARSLAPLTDQARRRS